ncbi:hypothetical protein GQ53DRAFT_33138 [Thozetella sp. PMI_491]|nr:hypothetical protein GQ53DRAFT_33138 [Thozetella sp. PMI_491]
MFFFWLSFRRAAFLCLPDFLGGRESSGYLCLVCRYNLFSICLIWCMYYHFHGQYRWLRSCLMLIEVMQTLLGKSLRTTAFV